MNPSLFIRWHTKITDTRTSIQRIRYLYRSILVSLLTENLFPRNYYEEYPEFAITLFSFHPWTIHAAVLRSAGMSFSNW